MIGVEFTVEGANAVVEAFHRAKPAILERWERTTRKHALRATRIWQQKYRSGPGTTASTLRVGTGALRASASEQTTRTETGVESVIGLRRLHAMGAALQYGAAHETGVTIRPSKARALAIPLPAVRSLAGIAPHPRDFPDAFVIKGKSGRGVLVRKLSDKTLQPLFIFRPEVRLPARPQGGAFAAAVKEVTPGYQADLEADALAALGGQHG